MSPPPTPHLVVFVFVFVQVNSDLGLPVLAPNIVLPQEAANFCPVVVEARDTRRLWNASQGELPSASVQAQSILWVFHLGSHRNTTVRKTTIRL